MAKKISGPQLILANRLDDGRAVFFTGQDWSDSSHDAAVAEGEALETLFEAASAFDARNQVFNLVRAEAEQTDAGPVPAHIKYRMQTKGPSVRLDLGYQSKTGEDG